MNTRVALLIVMLAGLLSTEKPGQHNAQASQDKTLGAPAASQTAANATDQKSTGDADKGQNQTVNVTVTPEMPADKAVTDWIIAICTIVLTVVGVIGTGAAIQTLRQIKRQADTLDEHKTKFEELATAAANNASAAMKSAEALIAGQRAWVTVDINLEPTGVVETTIRGEDGHYAIQIKMNYRNDGQTPAWITERRASLIVITDNVIPEHPDLSKAGIVAFGTVSLAAGRRHGYGHCDTPLQCSIDESPDRIYLVYGVVRYRTAFNRTGETTFGYRVTRGWDRLERLDERPEWNKNI